MFTEMCLIEGRNRTRAAEITAERRRARKARAASAGHRRDGLRRRVLRTLSAR